MTEQYAHLWWHLMDAHGLDAGGIHGDPELMHAAAHAYGISNHEHLGGGGFDKSG